MSGTPAREPYEQLLELAHQELEFARQGRYDALADIRARREAIIDGLPATPPPEARSTIELALLTQERVTIELLRGREQMLLALRRIALARQVARGYQRSIARRTRPTRIDTSA